MGKIIYNVATTLDGFIAGRDHDVSWCFTDADYGFSAFLESVEVILMGRTSYDVMKSLGPVPFSDKKIIVFTRTPPAESPDPMVTFTAESPEIVAARIKTDTERNIWLFGGAKIATILLNAGLVNEMVLSVHPIIAGAGVPLFSSDAVPSAFKFVRADTYPSGLVQMVYRQK